MPCHWNWACTWRRMLFINSKSKIHLLHGGGLGSEVFPAKGDGRGAGEGGEAPVPDEAAGLHISNPLVCAHHKEVNPVKNGFLLRAEEEVAALGAVHHQHHAVLLAEVCHRVKR